jgi:hypothetical protein
VLKKGGLGLKRIEEWNHASIMRNIWSIFANAGSIWVAWVKENLLRGRSFWKIGDSQISIWSWRKILKLRESARD